MRCKSLASISVALEHRYKGPFSFVRGHAGTMFKSRVNWSFFFTSEFQSQATGVELNRLLKSELQKGYCMPRETESQRNNTALFSNNQFVNGQALMTTVNLLHVCICLTWVLNCRPGSAAHFFQRPLVESNVRACCSLACSPFPSFHLLRLLTLSKSRRGEININQ